MSVESTGLAPSGILPNWDVPMTTTFSLSCECGKSVTVNIADAGGEKFCECGRRLAVPSLSELRRSIGQDPFESNVLDTVRRQLRECDNQIGAVCLHSGRSTSDRLWIALVCEQRRIGKNKSDRDWRPVRFLATLFAIVMLPLAGIVYLFSRMWAENSPSDSQELGHDRIINLPLPIDSDFHDEISEKQLLRYAKRIPLYAKIFEEFPGAVVARI